MTATRSIFHLIALAMVFAAYVQAGAEISGMRRAMQTLSAQPAIEQAATDAAAIFA